MLTEKSCGAVIFRMEGKIRKYLLLHYESGHWDFVKGNVEKGEEEPDTVRREAGEETGITDLKFVGGFRHLIKYFYTREKQKVSKEVIFYLAETSTEKIEISFEHIGYEWLGYEEAFKKLTFRSARDLLEKAAKFLHAAKN